MSILWKCFFCALLLTEMLLASQEEDTDGRRTLGAPEENYCATMALSWKAQLSDLRFVDYTDSLGHLKFWGRLKKIRSEDPYLFRISFPNQSKSLLLLGVAHFIPIEVFSEPIIKMLKNASLLIVEGRNKERFTREFLSTHKLLSLDVKWFDNLPRRVRQHIEWIFENVYGTMQLRPADLSSFFVHALYINAHWCGMDMQLEQYMEKRNRTIRALETFEEVFPQLHSLMPDHSIQSFNTDVKDNLLHGGMLNRPDFYEMSKAYLAGEMKPFLLDINEDKSLVRRNGIWVPRLLMYLKEQPTGILAAVGLAHLFDAAGLLVSFSKLGFIIEKSDAQGNWRSYKVSD